MLSSVPSPLCARLASGLKNMLFTEKDLRAARKEITARANTDLKTYATLESLKDGLFISVRAAVEAGILRLRQDFSAKDSTEDVTFWTLQSAVAGPLPHQDHSGCAADHKADFSELIQVNFGRTRARKLPFSC